ncbi:MAG TPA: hypothetical protein VFO25_08290 [Candidatus Eremiobacteraceae bacterium]|nr:hypothetical protein [Candidatus Eremiobacteraceae bacterium]
MAPLASSVEAAIRIRRAVKVGRAVRAGERHRSGEGEDARGRMPPGCLQGRCRRGFVYAGLIRYIRSMRKTSETTAASEGGRKAKIVIEVRSGIIQAVLADPALVNREEIVAEIIDLDDMEDDADCKFDWSDVETADGASIYRLNGYAELPLQGCVPSRD